MSKDLEGAAAALALLNAASADLTLSALAGQLRLAPERLQVLLDALEALDPLLLRRSDDRVRLTRPLNLLDRAYLHNHSSRGRVDLVAEAASTNSLLLEHCNNTVSGDVVIAEIQYNGRGRHGRSWEGSVGRQLTFSMAWSFGHLESITGLSVAVGTVITSTLRSLGFEEVRLKWPNDLYLGGAKCGGILVETRPSGRGLCSVIGTGINVFAGPMGLKAGSYGALEHDPQAWSTGHLERNFLAINLINAMREALRGFARHGFAPFADELEKFDYLRGRSVTVSAGSRTFRGRVLGVGSDGLLLLRSGAKTLSLRSGHVISCA